MTGSAPGLLKALRRFGVPQSFVDIMAAIYRDRTFRVSDCGRTSVKKIQNAGICQGCPLSSFLFIIVMTVLMSDAKAMLSETTQHSVAQNVLFDILYADDTMILGTNSAHVEEFAAAIEQAGKHYGMSLHWGKTQALSIGTPNRIRRPDGTVIEEKGSLVYLGGSGLC